MSSAGSSKASGKPPAAPITKPQAALKGSDTNTPMVTPPDDKGYKSELKETKALHKELHEV